jgi:hypothetical protein
VPLDLGGSRVSGVGDDGSEIALFHEQQGVNAWVCTHQSAEARPS